MDLQKQTHDTATAPCQLEKGLSGQSLAVTPEKRSAKAGSTMQDPEVVTGDMQTTDPAVILIPYANTPRMVDAPNPIALERPLLLPSLVPKNFSLVVPGVYRSSYPQTQDYAYLEGLKLKTIITLVSKVVPHGFQSFIDDNGIRHKIFDMTGTKKAEIPLALMQSVIAQVVDEKNHPVLIHCNHGKHRTGCVVGVLRKVNGWGTSSVLAEYQKYAQPKPRETDIQYLSEFQLADLKSVMIQTIDGKQTRTSIGHFLFLCIVTLIGLCLWFLTLGQFTTRPPLDPRKKSP